MARFPIIQAQNSPQGFLRPVQAGRVDLSGVRQGLQAVIEAGDRSQHREVMEMRQQQHEAAAEEKRKQHEAKMAREAADRAQTQAGEGMMRENLADAADALGMGVRDGTIDKTKAAQMWAEQSAKLVENGAKAIPDAHRPLVQQLMATHGERLQRQVITKSIRAKDQTDTSAGIDQTLEYAQRMAVVDPAGAKQLAHDTIDQLGPFAGWTSEQIAKRKNAYSEGAAFTEAYTAMTFAKGSNPRLAAVEKSVMANGDLDPQKKAVLLGQIADFQARNEARALAAAHRGALAEEKRLREASAAFDVLTTYTREGKMPDEAYGLELRNRMAGTPFAKAVPDLLAQVKERASFAQQPIAAQEAQLQGLIERRNTQGTNDALETEITKRTQILTAKRSAYEKDAIAAAAAYNVIDRPAPVDATNLDGLVKTIGPRVEQARLVGQDAGKPVSPLTAKEADAVADQLAALQPRERAAQVAQLAATMPKAQAVALAQQISKPNDRSLQFMMEDSTKETTKDRFVAEMYAKGAQAKKDGTSTKIENPAFAVKPAHWSATIANSLTGTFADAQSGIDATERAVLIAHAMSAESGGRLTENDLLRATRIALNASLVQRGPTVMKEGKMQQALIPLPAGIDEDMLDKRLRSVTRAELLKQAPSGIVRVGGVQVFLEDFVKSLPGQELMPARPGQFGVIVGGRTVTNEAGQTILIGVQ